MLFLSYALGNAVAKFHPINVDAFCTLFSCHFASLLRLMHETLHVRFGETTVPDKNPMNQMRLFPISAVDAQKRRSCVALAERTPHAYLERDQRVSVLVDSCAEISLHAHLHIYETQNLTPDFTELKRRKLGNVFVKISCVWSISRNVFMKIKRKKTSPASENCPELMA